MSIIWPPHSVKMASTPSFLSALATRLPPEIFWLASAAALRAAPSEEPTEDLSTAPAIFILLHEHFHFFTSALWSRAGVSIVRLRHTERSHCSHLRKPFANHWCDSYIVSRQTRQSAACRVRACVGDGCSQPRDHLAI